MLPQDIFDRKARRAVARRSASARQSERWLVERMAEELAYRVSLGGRDEHDVLLIGPSSVALSSVLHAKRIIRLGADILFDEDRMPFASESFDLIVATGQIDTINDLPGFLRLSRMILRPRGRLLAAMAGAGSLTGLRRLWSRTGDSAARFHPEIDVRIAGDLLARAGFALAVADGDSVAARYRGLPRLLGDLRDNALTCVLAERHPVQKASAATLAEIFKAETELSGSFVEQFAIIFLSGEAPLRD